MKRLTVTLTTMALSFGLAGNSSADLVATDLNAGGADMGFSEAWDGSSNVRISSDLEFPADLLYANYGIAQTGTPGNVYSANTAHNDRMDSRNLAAAMSGDIWFSALVNVPSGGNFAGLAFDSDAEVGNKPVESFSHQLSELRVVLTDTQLVVDMDGGAPPTATGTETGTFAAGTTHLILGKMTVGAGNDTLSVWVDPNLNLAGGPGGLPTANFTSTTVDFMDEVARIGVPISDSAGNDSLQVDAIRVSDTATAFEDVTGVSGPGILFAITKIEYDPDTEPNGTVTLTWRKTGAATYIAKVSPDMTDWGGDLDDSISAGRDENPGDTDHITVTFPLDGVRPDAPELFFRIEEG